MLKYLNNTKPCLFVQRNLVTNVSNVRDTKVYYRWKCILVIQKPSLNIFYSICML